MTFRERIGLAALRSLDPETAHHLALRALKAGLAPLPGPVTTPRLATCIAGLDLPNPVGLAAGFDKNAKAISPLSRAGFGFLEIGAVTPRPQKGNSRPRLFRLIEDRAVINRLGFNNDGADVIARRLAARSGGIPLGINMGANKNSPDRAVDFAEVLRRCGAHIDFATVNVSSPNTERLRDLQGAKALAALLKGVNEAKAEPGRQVPVFLKISPDLADAELSEIAEVALTAGIDAIIATNTTVARDGLNSRHRIEPGGLSGCPLFELSTRVLARLHEITNGRIPLIGVGGISSAEDAYAKIRAGASAVQLYTALAYEGISLAPRIASGLDTLLSRDGFEHVADAVGVNRADWL